MNKENKYQELCHILNYQFANYGLLEEALTHPSSTVIINDKENNYQRLEFLGDAVLELVITELLMIQYPKEHEGDLAKRRSALVCRDTIANIAKNLNIGQYLIMTPGEDHSGGRHNENNLENTLEAIIGAIYLDGGIEQAKIFIHHAWSKIIANMQDPPQDPKTSLQEWAQKHDKGIPQYITINSHGPAHSPIFLVEARIEGFASARASAASKKLAARLAADLLLKNILHLSD